MQLSYPAQETTGLRSAGLNGDYTPQQALQKLLVGAGLQAETTVNGTITLARQGGLMTVADTAPAPSSPADSGQMMPKVTVEADTENGSPYDDPTWTNDPENTGCDKDRHASHIAPAKRGA